MWHEERKLIQVEMYLIYGIIKYHRKCIIDDAIDDNDGNNKLFNAITSCRHVFSARRKIIHKSKLHYAFQIFETCLKIFVFVFVEMERLRNLIIDVRDF